MSYQKIKSDVLDAYFDFCRDRGWKMNFSHGQVLGSVSYEFENVYESNEDKLMFCVVLMVLSGGWYAEPIASAREWVTECLNNKTVENIFQNMEHGDADFLRLDMNALGLL